MRSWHRTAPAALPAPHAGAWCAARRSGSCRRCGRIHPATGVGKDLLECSPTSEPLCDDERQTGLLPTRTLSSRPVTAPLQPFDDSHVGLPTAFAHGL